MATQFEVLKGTNIYDDLYEGHTAGFKIMRNLVDVNLTALDVVKAYQYADKKKYLQPLKEINYNNRWLQFKGEFEPESEKVARYMKKRFKFSQQHIYANWIPDGFSFGRHKDGMDVIILQCWNTVAYTVESPYGEKENSSFVLSPGDAIYIRSGVYHTPIIFGERMTMSFSWPLTSSQ